MTTPTIETLTLIPVARIVPNPQQPRKTFELESIRELAESIRESGLIEPIIIEDDGENGFTLVAGERRLRAVQYLNRENILAVVREKTNHNGRERLLDALTENIQREDMNVVDIGEAYELLATEHHMSNVEISLKVGKSSTLVGQFRRIAKLPHEIKEMIRAGSICYDPMFVSALQSINDPAMRVKVAKHVAEHRLTILQSVAMVRKAAGIVKEPRVELGKEKSVAMHLVQKANRRLQFDEKTPPKGWTALEQVGRVPRWTMLTNSVTAACKACDLQAQANDATCRLCPLVDMLKHLLNEV